MFPLGATMSVVDAALALLLIEAVVLTTLRKSLRHRLSVIDVLANATSGGMILLALRFSLASPVVASPVSAAVPVCIAVAGIAHAVDVARRW